MIGNNRFSIRAETSGQTFSSILLELNSNTGLNHKQTENLAPYALFGGEPSTNYYGRMFPQGQYTIKATSYQEPNLQGVASPSLEINFFVKDKVINDLIWVDAKSNQEIDKITPGIIFPCLKKASILARVNPEVQSVRFVFNTPTGTIDRIENHFPFTLLGEDFEGNYQSFQTAIGDNYEITVQAYAKKNAQGDLLDSKTYHFGIDGDYTLNDLSILDASSGEVLGKLTNSNITIPPGGISFRVENECVDRVRFQLRDQDRNLALIFRHENSVPYTLLGETPDGQLIPWKPTPGIYELRLESFSKQLADGKLTYKSESLRSYFFRTINDVSDKADNSTETLLYPNPSFQKTVYLELPGDVKGTKRIEILDNQGNTLFTQTIDSKRSPLDISRLKPGYYIINILDKEGVIRKPLMIH